MNNAIDKLFRDELKQAEIRPSDAAWSKLEGSLVNKKSPYIFWYRMAAAVGLVGLLLYLFNQHFDINKKNQLAINSAIDHPVIESYEHPAIFHNYTMMVTSKSSIPKILNELNPSLPAQLSPGLKDVSTRITELTSELENKGFFNEPIWETNEIQVVKNDGIKAAEEENQPAILIIYSSSNKKKELEEPEKKSENKVLKSLIASAAYLLEDDLMVNIRATKDQLFNNGIKKITDINDKNLKD
ncbi:MAG TPA: hypothetical protein ACFCUD_07455 [Cyclobacteriaceae bacterium]